MSRRFCAFVVGAGLAAGACAPSAERDARSPSLDYPHPQPNDPVDFRAMGADGVPPQDQLRRGARLTPEGFVPSDHPAYQPEHGAHDHHPPRPCDEGEPSCRGTKDGTAPAESGTKDGTAPAEGGTEAP